MEPVKQGRKPQGTYQHNPGTVPSHCACDTCTELRCEMEWAKARYENLKCEVSKHKLRVCWKCINEASR